MFESISLPDIYKSAMLIRERIHVCFFFLFYLYHFVAEIANDAYYLRIIVGIFMCITLKI